MHLVPVDGVRSSAVIMDGNEDNDEDRKEVNDIVGGPDDGAASKKESWKLRWRWRMWKKWRCCKQKCAAEDEEEAERWSMWSMRRK